MITPETRLTIHKNINLEAKNVQNGELFTVKQMQVGRFNREGSISYYNVTNLTRTALLEIAIRDGMAAATVEMPEPMLARMADYVRTKELQPAAFNCLSFAKHANGLPQSQSAEGIPQFEPHYWDICPMDDEASLKSGDTVFIAELPDPTEYSATHFAVYLNDGLYLSKFGNTGPLIASSLPEMKKGFGGDHTFQIVPRDDFVE